jgi:hypothetical protein
VSALVRSAEWPFVEPLASETFNSSGNCGDGRPLIERVDLLLDQRQVAQRIEYVVALIGAGMARNPFRPRKRSPNQGFFLAK